MAKSLFTIYLIIQSFFAKGDVLKMQQQYISLGDGTTIELMLPIGTKNQVWNNRRTVELFLPYDGESVYFFLYKGYQVFFMKGKKTPATAKDIAEASFKEMFNALLTRYYFIPPSRLKDAASIGYYYESVFPRLPMRRHVRYFVKYQQDIYWISIITEPDNFERLRPAIYNILRSIRIIDISDLQEKHSNEALY